MKTKILAICCMLSAVFFVACEKPIEEQQRDEQLLLEVSKDSVACVARMGEMPALQMTWTAGTNHGTGSAIAYTIDLDRTDSAFSGGVHFEIGRTMDRTLALSHRQLSDTLSLYFPDMIEEQYEYFDLRVRAKVLMTGEEQVSPAVTVAIALFSTDTTNLYLVGDATPNGWDKGRASMMQWDMNMPSQFTWTGQLHKGEFKILLNQEDWFPCYVRDSTDATKMIYRATEEDYPDFKWEIAKTGNYTLTVDIKTLTIDIAYLGGEAYSHLYMIGDATPGGWSWDNITEMSHPEENIFTYEGYLSVGAIKFPTELKSDWSGEMLFAPVPDCAPSANGTFDAHKGDPDNKWLIPQAGIWSITVNFKDTTISFVQL